MIGYFIGRRYRSINLLLHYRPWWLGKWTKVKLEMGPVDIAWSPKVEDDITRLLEEMTDEERGRFLDQGLPHP